MKEYYNYSSNEVRKQINNSYEPLTDKEVKQNQEKFGKNEIVEGKKKSRLRIFIEQFNDFLVIVLICAAIISGFLKDIESMIVILVVITMNAILGTVQTIKAESSLDSLKKMSSPMAKVLRGGEVIEISSREVTVGDEVYLEAGDAICADGRLLESASLKVDESALTGESLGVDKTVDVIEGEVPLGDRKNMVYSGSFVAYGRGSFLVTDIGMNTEVGKIATLLKSASDKKTPLQVNLDNFGKRLSIIIMIFCAFVFGVNVIRGNNITDAFLFAVALAVAAIPEALSSIVTIVLSFGTQKMAKEGAIIRKLQAVEGLGSVSIICSDKTGTLTKNKMTVEDYYVDGEHINVNDINIDNPIHEKILKYSMLCNDSTNVNGEEIGDPTEVALINVGNAVKVYANELREAYPRISEIPFDSDRKLMSTFHKINDEHIMITKGAVDVIIPKTKFIHINGEIRNITDEDKEKINRKNDEFSEKGLRVLAVGYKKYNEEKIITLTDEDGYIFLGLISMMDPPRDESMMAVDECKRAGIKPIMITGDHKSTASAIAKKIGILENESEACEGAVIDKMSDKELEKYVEGISVYARVSPEHKIRIVKAWQNRGNIVAMTGDGVNDAPALKQADVGVAMGITGTEVSKDASAMILTDDNFATIVKAVENGRNVYANIKRSIQFLLSGNLSAIIAVLYASLLALPVPFCAVHLLFINLLTDSLPAIALGLEPHKKSVMNEKPRPMNESILTKSFMKRILVDGLVIAITTMTAYYIGLNTSSGTRAASVASTMAFATLCLGRLVHGYNCKSKSIIMFKKGFFNNVALQIAFLVGVALLSAVLFIPGLHSMFKIASLSVMQIVTIFGLAVLNLPIIQFIKKFNG